MSENTYNTPSSNLLDENDNGLKEFDYHELEQLVSGRRKVLVLVVFTAIAALASLFSSVAIVMGIGGPIAPPNVTVGAIVGALFGGIILALIAYGVYSSNKWGLFVGVVAALLYLFIFPLGTFIGILALRGLYQARSIYLEPGYNFEALKEAYRRHA